MSATIRIQHTEGEDLQLLARPVGGETTLYAEDVSAARIAVFDTSGSTPNTDLLLSSGTTTKALLVANDPDGATAEVMFTSSTGAQTDDSWPKVGGYTFACTLRDSELHLEGGHTYRVEVELDAGHATPTWPQRLSYGTLVLVWFVAVTPVAAL